jgi:hypothetical protein
MDDMITILGILERIERPMEASYHEESMPRPFLEEPVSRTWWPPKPTFMPTLTPEDRDLLQEEGTRYWFHVHSAVKDELQRMVEAFVVDEMKVIIGLPPHIELPPEVLVDLWRRKDDRGILTEEDVEVIANLEGRPVYDADVIADVIASVPGFSVVMVTMGSFEDVA